MGRHRQPAEILNQFPWVNFVKWALAGAFGLNPPTSHWVFGANG